MAVEIDFEKMQGLAPAVVQDAATGEVLMLGFMNRAAYERTLATGYVTFYSRTRNELWTKGETSGNRLKVVSAQADCDRWLRRAADRNPGGRHRASHRDVAGVRTTAP